MRLLIVEDEIKLSKALAVLLRKNGYVVDVANDGIAGFDLAANGIYDLIVLDHMLPGIDGLSVLKELRKLSFRFPILILTAKESTVDRIEGLDAGADDYIVKPFAKEELVARIRALLRRKDKEWTEPFLSIPGLMLHPLRCEVVKGNKSFKLSIKETLLLELLIRHKGQVVSKEQIYRRVWGHGSDIRFTNIDLYIHYLRKKLGTSLIQTVRGFGYIMKED